MPSPLLSLTFGDLAVLAGLAMAGLLAYLVAYLIVWNLTLPLLDEHLGARGGLLARLARLSSGI